MNTPEVANRASRKGCPKLCVDCHLLMADSRAEVDWSLLSKDAEYMCSQFFELEGPKGKPLAPSSRKGGPWLRAVGHELTLTSRFMRALTGHAPLGAFRQRFNLGDGDNLCHCGGFRGPHPLETRDHVLRRCAIYTRPHPRHAPRLLEEFITFLRENPSAFSFPPSPTVREEEGGDPG